MSDEKKIIIDEDWKSQVETEKQTAEQVREEQPAAGDLPPAPPADLQALVSMFATQAMMALGQIPDPLSGQVMFQPEQAKFMVDLIEVIEQKTTGNRTPEEDTMVETILHQLRMAYVQLTAEVPTDEPEAGESKSPIIT